MSQSSIASPIAIIIAAVAALGGFAVGTRVGVDPPPLPTEASPPAVAAPPPELLAELDAARREAAELRAELERRREEAKPSVADSPPPPAGVFSPRGGPGRVIRSIGEAEAAFERAMAAGDLEALWLLGADLLALGEEAYPLFERLLEQFIAAAEGGGPFGEAWDDEELWMGRFFRVLAEEHESFLAYGLHLARSDAQELGPALERLRHDIFDEEMLPVLLAFHGAENPELVQGWLDQLEAQFELPDLGGMDEESLIFSLAQIPDDRAVDLLVRWLETRASHHDEAFRALLLQGSPSALAALRRLLPLVGNGDLRSAIEDRLGG